MKKISAIILALCVLFACGCASNREKTPSGGNYVIAPVTEIPEFTDDGTYEFWIGGWNGPSTTDYEKAFQILADGGFNHMPLSDVLMSTSTMVAYLDYAEKYGVKVYPQMNGRVVSTVESRWGNVFDSSLEKKGLGGFYYYDEPGSGVYESFLPLVEDHNEKYAKYGLDFIINLYSVYYYDQAATNESSSYLEYVMQYCEKVLTKVDGFRFLSADHYPLCYSKGANGSMVYYLDPEWLITCETIAECAKSFDVFPHYYLLSTGHYNVYRDATEARLRYQANIYMAYGAQGLSHFTTHGNKDLDPNSTRFNTDSMISADGCSTRPTYEYAKTVNNEILSWDHVFMQYDWQGVKYVLGEGNENNALFAKTQFGMNAVPAVEMLVSSGDMIAGYFTDKDNRPAYMLANFADPDQTSSEAITVNMVIEDANNAIIYRRGVPEVVELSEGALSLELGVAEAAFVIPVNLQK